MFQKSKLYVMWANMKSRCKSTNRKDSKYYSLKGVRVCDEWLNFSKFEKWALSNGYEDGLSIERNSGDGNYEPSNCKFIELPLQQRNKSNNILLTYNGETKVLGEWAIIHGLHWKTLKSRIDLGFTVEEALEKKEGVLRISKFFNYNGKDHTISQLARICNIPKGALALRIKRGLSLNEAMNKPLKDKPKKTTA